MFKTLAITGSGLFCQKGDSGGPVYYVEKAIKMTVQGVGYVLGYGQVEDGGKYITAYIVADIQAVVADIEERYGIKLVLADI